MANHPPVCRFAPGLCQFVHRAAILDRFFVKVMSYEMEHSFLRNDLD